VCTQWLPGLPVAEHSVQSEGVGFFKGILSQEEVELMAFVEDRWKHDGNESRRRWRARYRAPDGRERSQSFLRKADARRFAAEREAAVRTGLWIDPRAGTTPLRIWAEKVMASRLHLRPATLVREVAYLNNHVLAAFGNRAISHISKEAVQAWVQFLHEDKV
jgi:hypothetical protein